MKRLFLLLAFLPVLLTAQQADPGFAKYRNTALTSTDVQVKAGQSNLFGFTFVNVNTSPVYVKVYDGLAANVTVGTTAPIAVIEVPAGDGTTSGTVILAPGTISFRFVNSGLTIAAVTGLADNSSSAPSTAIYAELLYK